MRYVLYSTCWICNPFRESVRARGTPHCAILQGMVMYNTNTTDLGITGDNICFQIVLCISGNTSLSSLRTWLINRFEYQPI